MVHTNETVFFTALSGMETTMPGPAELGALGCELATLVALYK
jgi:hypothetical protein